MLESLNLGREEGNVRDLTQRGVKDAVLPPRMERRTKLPRSNPLVVRGSGMVWE